MERDGGRRIAIAAVVAALAAGGLLLGRAPAGELDSNGTFRFLTQSLPIGSTNAEYVARLLTANADGPVTFSVSALPNGMALDPLSGFLTGRPTTTYNSDVTLTADDGSSVINLSVNLKINASGGGGNAGSTFANDSLAEGRVGTPYTETLGIENGVGPFVYGAADLPPGISLNGLTGVLSGNPLAPGTYFANLSVVDFGENDNKVLKVLPLTVLPDGSEFRWSTLFLNNGEVGTPYCDTLATTGGAGAVSYAASGLPAGLSVDPGTGVISGAPTESGTFVVNLTASDSSDTLTTNLSMIVVPGSESSFYWDYFGIPVAIVNVPYDRQPPILVPARNGATIAYSVIGLPSGMAYNPTTGELTGTPVEVGEYPVTFLATDPGTGDTIVLSLDFLVLPPNGGDAASIAVNFWVLKQKLKTGEPGEGAWAAAGIYNADRRAGNAFDPASDTLLLQIGSRALVVDPGEMTGTTKAYRFASPRGETPIEKVLLSPAKQSIKWTTRKDTFTETVPATLRHTLILGGRGYRLDEEFDDGGVFRPAAAYRRTAFVIPKGAVKAGTAGKDSIKLSLLLADPAFVYEPGVTTLRFRLLDGAAALLDRDFTALGTGTASGDGAGSASWSLKGLKDPATTDRVARFRFQGTKGKMTLALSGLTLAGVPAGEAHLGFELTVGERVYFTSVTLFEKSAGVYTTTMP